MANQVTDNRTQIATGETVSNWIDLGGNAGVVDVEVSYDTYSGSIGDYCTTTRGGTLYNNGTTGLFTAGDHAYLLVNCGIVSLLDTKANGGLTVRVTGASISNWAEFRLFGSDDWPTAFDGGWIQLVVDIDELLANPSATGGTPPTSASQIQRFGVTYVTASTMPRMADNIWVGGFFRLPANTPAIIVEGRSGGSADWTWELIRNVPEVKLSAVIRNGPAGSYISRGPVQFGISDTSTHVFNDTNSTLLWDFQEVMNDGFYSLSALGNSGGTTNVTFGIKSGTGNDATGAQGGVLQAGSTAARFNMDFDDPDVDAVNLYGCVLIHGGDYQLDDAAVDAVGNLLIDCTSSTISNSNYLKNNVLNPDVLSSDSYITTDDLGDLKQGVFESDGTGHAVELTSLGSGTMIWGATTSGYDAGVTGSPVTATNTGNETIWVNVASGTLTINVAAGATTPSIRSAGAVVNVVSSFNLTLTDIASGVNVTIVNSASRAERFHTTSTGVDIVYPHSGGETVDILLNSLAYDPNLSDIYDLALPNADSSIKFQMIDDTNYENN